MTKDLYDKLMVFGNDQEPFLAHNFMRTTDLDDGTDLAGINAHFKGGQLLAQRFVNGLCGNFSH